MSGPLSAHRILPVRLSPASGWPGKQRARRSGQCPRRARNSA